MTLRSTPFGITDRPLCAGCGQPFMRAYVRQIRCRPGCGRVELPRLRSPESHNGARAEQRAGPKSFVGIDGEGVTDPLTGEHSYVLLSCGDKHLSLDGLHLGWNDVFTFLWQCFTEAPEAVYVGFYLGYDFSQWFRTLPEERARMLLDEKVIAAKRRRRDGLHKTPWPVRHNGWEFDVLAKKRFKLRPEGKPPRHTPKNLLSSKGTWKWLYVNDAGSYFQCTFLKAVDPHDNPNPVVSLEEYAILERGKARRNVAEFDLGMVEYNQLECDVLCRLMAQLDEGFREEGLRPARHSWHGPGQAAQLWMRKIGVPKGEAVRGITPAPVLEAARCSYFGGWFEIFWHGPMPGESFGYDINSAYPYVMSRMPCLMHGRWSHRQEKPAGRLLTWAQKAGLGEGELGIAFVRARVEGSHPIVGAMPHRNANRTIMRPRTTEGWFVAAELAAAIRAHFVERVRLFETWAYHPCEHEPPLAGIAELYEGRLKVGKASPAGKARKLVYNSVAGKLQQSVGDPAFANPVYATMITSGCRTMILDAIATHPRGARDLLMVATDGVVFASPHTGLAMHKERLGAWTGEIHNNLSLFMPGVYWDDGSRTRIAEGLAPAFKSRGIAGKDLAAHIGRLDAAWAAWGTGAIGVVWPKMQLDVSFQLISPKQALARKKWELCGTVNTDKHRVVSANPEAKRIAAGPGRSKPYHEPQPLPAEIRKKLGLSDSKYLSLPYDGLFGDEMRAFADDEFGDHPDGRVADLLVEALLGRE